MSFGDEPLLEEIRSGDPDDLLSPSDAARLLGISADAVRVIADAGRLPTLRTVGGRRLFRRGDVDRLVLERAQARRPRL